MILNHVGLRVTDFARSRDFYTAALGTLGIKLLAEFEAGGHRHGGYGAASDEHATFWIDEGKKHRGEAHVAFTANSRAEVEAFYSAALSNAGRDNGRPGLRAEYHPDYYAAFVLDPDGHNIEAVYIGPAGGRP